MKVAIVQNILAPYRIPLFNKLNEHFEICVLLNRESTGDRYWNINKEEVNFKCYCFRGKEIRIFNKYIIITSKKSIISRISKEKIDILILTDDLRCILTNIFLILAKKKYKYKIILWCSEFLYNPRKERIFKILRLFLFLYKKFLVKNSDSFIAYSINSLEYYSNTYNIPKEKMVWGTQSTYIEPIDIRLKNFDNSIKRILYLGYLRKGKGIEILIDICKNELRTEPFVLYIVGDGPLREAMVAQVGNFEKIVFKGYIEGIEKHNMLLSSDILVLLTTYDQWANVLNESAAYAIPVITTKYCGANGMFLVNGFNSLIVDPSKRDEIVFSLRRMIKDDAFRKEIAVNIWETGKKFSIEWASNNFLEAINIVKRVKK